MNEVRFIQGHGGLVSDAILSELRKPKPQRSAKQLAEPRSFDSPDKNLGSSDRSQSPPALPPGPPSTTTTSRGDSLYTSFDDFETDLEFLFNQTRHDWNLYQDKLADLNTSTVRRALLIPLFIRLGFSPQYITGKIAATKEDSDRNRYGITHWGWEIRQAYGDRYQIPPPMILTSDDLDRKPDRGKPSPHEEMQQFLNASTPHRWGIAANQYRIRVLRDFHHTGIKGGIAIDVADLLEASSFADFRALVRLVHVSRFICLLMENV